MDVYNRFLPLACTQPSILLKEDPRCRGNINPIFQYQNMDELYEAIWFVQLDIKDAKERAAPNWPMETVTDTIDVNFETIFQIVHTWDLSITMKIKSYIVLSASLHKL